MCAAAVGRKAEEVEGMSFTMVDFARWFFDGVKVFCGCLGFITAAVAVLCVLAVLGGVVGLFIRTGRGGEE